MILSVLLFAFDQEIGTMLLVIVKTDMGLTCVGTSMRQMESVGAGGGVWAGGAGGGAWPG